MKINSYQDFPEVNSFTSVLFVHLKLLPEVGDELPEGVHPPRQRNYYVDEDASCVQVVTLHLHQRPKWPKENELGEVLRAAAFEHQLIYSPCVPLCASQS